MSWKFSSFSSLFSEELSIRIFNVSCRFSVAMTFQLWNLTEAFSNCPVLIEEAETMILLAWLTPACLDTVSPCGVPSGAREKTSRGQLGSLGLRPGAFALLHFPLIVQLRPYHLRDLARKSEGSECPAGSECSSVVGKFEKGPGWEEQDLIDRVQAWSGLFHISFLNNHSFPCPQGSLALSPLLFF